MSLARLFIEESIDECVIVALQLLKHDCHHSDVVVVNQVYLTKVKGTWELTVLVCKEEMGYCLLRLKVLTLALDMRLLLLRLILARFKGGSVSESIVE